MTYANGELSTVTDGKVKYGITKNKSENSATFGVYENDAFIPLEKVTRDNDNDVVTKEYYRNDTETDRYISTYDKYGRIEKQVYGTTETNYGYTVGGESRNAQLLCEVVDGYSGRVVSYDYNDDSSIKKVNSIKEINYNEIANITYDLGDLTKFHTRPSQVMSRILCKHLVDFLVF